ncbi:hypothetical protein, partial [Ruminococcus champanellensis]|uniref:hypothetical protein n=1 Tax=Ruminococcus champanellensis TaxID=1161942 RepID=UPI0023F44D2E
MGLPDAWGVVCDSICLTVWVTHDPFTGVRATTVLSFSTTLPTLLGNEPTEQFPRFQPSNLIPLRFVQH